MGLFFDTSICNGTFRSADDADVKEKLDLLETIVRREWMFHGRVDRAEISALFKKYCPAVRIEDDAETDLFLHESCWATYDMSSNEENHKYVLIAKRCKFVVGDREQLKQCREFQFSEQKPSSSSSLDACLRNCKWKVKTIADEMTRVIEQGKSDFHIVIQIAEWKRCLPVNVNNKDVKDACDDEEMQRITLETQNMSRQMQDVIDQGYANVDVLHHVTTWRNRLLEINA